MFKRLILLIALVAILAFVRTAVAQDSHVIQIPTDNYGTISYIADGRLNGADLAAPVAVYYTYKDVLQSNGKFVKTVDGIQLLSIDPKTNNGTLTMQIPLSDLISTIDTGKHQDGMLLAQNNGFSLYYSSSNWFWVTAPPDKEGKVYSFKWQNFSVLHD